VNDREKGTMTRAEGQLLVKFVKTWLFLLPGGVSLECHVGVAPVGVDLKRRIKRRTTV